MQSIIRLSAVILIPVVALGLYIASLFRQLESAFQRQQQWIPTRLYSDVTRIGPGSPRATVEDRLKALAYSFQSQGREVKFTLHPIRYPDSLIPSDHPTWALAEKQTPIT
ncbi:MAG: hypothetical protein KGQ59_03585, partial [Bdellovibrionales bacterium]|nr:hypothetical protein [Bdellovibrionales bacterium]